MFLNMIYNRKCTRTIAKPKNTVAMFGGKNAKYSYNY
jgi:hypothetical protein